MKRIILLFLISVFCVSAKMLVASVSEKNQNYPFVILQNDSIKVTILMPDEHNGYYRSTRFDWSGMIAQVEYKGHEFFQSWKMYNGTVEGGIHDPLLPGTGTGTAEEFRNPLGYEDAKKGEYFVKIGVGILEKADESKYFWDYPYKIIQPGKWDIEFNQDRIIFKQILLTDFGYAYEYEKQIKIADNKSEIEISHMLRNCGDKEISANPYCHNFFSFDNYPVGIGYKIVFPNNVYPVDKFDSGISFKENKITINIDDLNSEWLGGFINPGESKSYSVVNTKNGTSVKVIEDKSFGPFYLYMTRLSICPEPMIEFTLKKGESFTWKRNYCFTKI